MDLRSVVGLVVELQLFWIYFSSDSRSVLPLESSAFRKASCREVIAVPVKARKIRSRATLTSFFDLLFAVFFNEYRLAGVAAKRPPGWPCF